MPRKLKPGDVINGYTILQEINIGAMAMSYAARASDGEKVFFKLYKSPTPTVPWYKDYLAYQRELKRRIETTAARGFTYRFMDQFEALVGAASQPTFFQVFEFVEGGEDLEKVLETIRTRPSAVAWDQRLTMAKVMMAGIGALHDALIVHGDLKPANLQLFRDPSIGAGYRLKIIDMDYSVLADTQAPWHGHQGYVGTPHYFSPEHLAGIEPVSASDVFTCGLILYELLAQGHPYPTDDDAEFQRKALEGRPPEPRLAGSMPDPTANKDVIAILQHCLAPDPVNRPSAKDVNLVLNGRMGAEEYVPPPPGAAASRPAPPRPAPPPPVPVAVASAGSDDAGVAIATKPAVPEEDPPGAQLELRNEAGVAIKFRIRTTVGKHLCRQFGDDARFLDVEQFTILPDGSGGWSVEPNAAAVNETLLNGKALKQRTIVASGDVVAVGREAKGTIKLPLSIHIR